MIVDIDGSAQSQYIRLESNQLARAELTNAENFEEKFKIQWNMQHSIVSSNEHNKMTLTETLYGLLELIMGFNEMVPIYVVIKPY